jgi:hypothetical protein
LEGTCYIEVLPGSYNGQCWNEGSLFFDEEVFGYLEPIIEKHVSAYNHYAFTEIEKTQWLAITDDFEHLNAQISSSTTISDFQEKVGFIFNGTGERFSMNFHSNKAVLIQLISEFISWVKIKLNQYTSLTILGI